MDEKWGREVSFKRLREDHRAVYYVLAGTAWAAFAFFLLLFLLLLFSAVNPWMQARVIISDSMEPAIITGSMVIVVPQDGYHEGDIISFVDPDIGINVHRIVGEVSRDGETYFITKGDNARRADRTPVPLDKVEGKVVLIFPYLGYLAYLGFLVALIPIGLIVLRLVRKVRSRAAAGGGG
ncbi:MAG: signal peptidase I [Actinomycetota bacterium]